MGENAHGVIINVLVDPTGEYKRQQPAPSLAACTRSDLAALAIENILQLPGSKVGFTLTLSALCKKSALYSPEPRKNGESEPDDRDAAVSGPAASVVHQSPTAGVRSRGSGRQDESPFLQVHPLNRFFMLLYLLIVPCFAYFLPREMFCHINKKGMEVTLHYLFNKLDSHLAYEEFRYMYMQAIEVWYMLLCEIFYIQMYMYMY